MNDQQQMIQETVSRILRDHCSKEVVDAAEAGNWAAGLWQNLEDNGLTLAGIPEANGGIGGDYADSLLVLREAAGFAAPLPLAETLIAAHLLALAGEQVPMGPLTLATGDFSLKQEGQGFRLTGYASEVAFLPWAQVLLVPVAGGQPALCRLNPTDITATTRHNMAGEPRSDITVDTVLAAEAVSAMPVDPLTLCMNMGAAARAVQMTGALTSVLNLSVQYAMERTQFGKAISGFQAIQHQLATLACEVAACQRAADALMTSPEALSALDLAVAKARIGEAVSLVTDIAHQVHGAMGYTMEHSLNLRTRRLWCWRDEYQREAHWEAEIGKLVVAGGADNLWNLITTAS
ncbi:MAG: acyl-CoA/acyl-ACP dehydrogenase [Pseudomonadales bacterium]|nr:acyl-CoA/acyl-ACP dehydrogenase [Pseudomonadales bacterium]